MHATVLSLFLFFSLPAAGTVADSDPVASAARATTDALKSASLALMTWEQELETVARTIAERDNGTDEVTIDLRVLKQASENGERAHESTLSAYSAYRTLVNRRRQVTTTTLAIAARVARITRAIQRASERTAKVQALVPKR